MTTILDSKGVFLEHYYGDYVRAIFVVLAVLIGLYVTLDWDVTIALAIEAPSIVVLVVLAGLTNPHNKLVMLGDAAASIIGIVITEWLAVSAYTQQYYYALSTLECISIGFLFALYLSVKTVRAMEAGKVGYRETPGKLEE